MFKVIVYLGMFCSRLHNKQQVVFYGTHSQRKYILTATFSDKIATILWLAQRCDFHWPMRTWRNQTLPV